MRFFSTRGGAPPASLSEAVFQGLAIDGGLYQPDPLPRLTPSDLGRMAELTWPLRASELARPFLEGEVEDAEVPVLASSAFGFPLPLVHLKERVWVLELFRGPTLAFKDIGARFLARLVAHLRPAGSPSLVVLTATSGDTGGAVAHAFLGLPGVRVVILFPDGQITPRQERQFSTLGANVVAVAVRGDFDACQRLAKGAFRDPALRGRIDLTSANSINVGRFLPQSFYYIHAWEELATAGVISGGGSSIATAGGEEAQSQTTGPSTPELLFSVPSGNFGNLAAGLLAKAMGLPGVRFLAATNVNDEVPEYLRTGIFAPRPSRRTLSTAMDVGNPSNFARILHLYGGDVGRIRADVAGRSVTDSETLACIRRVRDDTGYVLDPHSAVGMRALEDELGTRPGAVGVLLATAHPAKFAEVVEPVLGEALPVPPELARCLEAPRKVVHLEPGADALRELLLDE